MRHHSGGRATAEAPPGERGGAVSQVRRAVRDRGGAGPLVLLADEAGSARSSTVAFLVAGGYRVRAVADCEAALRELAQQPVDVLVTELVLVGPRGGSLIAGARSIAPQAKLVVLTAYPGCDEQVASLADAYLHKPVGGDRICEVLAGLLGARDHGLHRPPQPGRHLQLA